MLNLSNTPLKPVSENHDSYLKNCWACFYMFECSFPAKFKYDDKNLKFDKFWRKNSKFGPVVVTNWLSGGHLYLKLNIILVKIYIIRVVFQDQAMYVRTSFRGPKTCKIGEKGVFLVMFTNFGKEREKFRKKHAKCIFRVYFHTWKICALGVFWKSSYKDDIQPEIQVPPPCLWGKGLISHIYHQESDSTYMLTDWWYRFSTCVVDLDICQFLGLIHFVISTTCG